MPGYFGQNLTLIMGDSFVQSSELHIRQKEFADLMEGRLPDIIYSHVVFWEFPKNDGARLSRPIHKALSTARFKMLESKID